jgi:hypothetical protein
MQAVTGVVRSIDRGGLAQRSSVSLRFFSGLFGRKPQTRPALMKASRDGALQTYLLARMSSYVSTAVWARGAGVAFRAAVGAVD